jgi:hypothetical protein
MSTTPQQGGGPPMGATFGAPGSIARMPMPGNAEFALYLAVELIFAIIWVASKQVSTQEWVIYTTVLTAFYMLSRGIAKASRVLEA